MESPGARRHRARPSRARPLLYTALAALTIVGGTAAGTVYVKAQAHSGAAPVSSAGTPSADGAVTADGDESMEPVAQPTVDRDALLAKAMTSVAVPADAEVSVAVLDVASGARAGYGDGAFDTASIVKVDILAALLLQAQDAGRQLTAAERTYATAMIENSDNASATALWDVIGEADGLDAANKRFGLTDTAGGDGALWGLTQTTAADQLTLLGQVFGDDSKLSAASRAYLQGLMGRIAADQHWGVSAAADGSAWALKNGWLARSGTGLWDINSVGRVTAGGRQYLVAVVSRGSTTQAEGVTLVESAAKAAVRTLTEETTSTTSTAGTTAKASAKAPSTSTSSG
ncbi:serine hydrolase [Streptomyces griseoviridis]|uniref:serine hydrolase n=1 Tax=Streptomyces griseoviridis TaxID=45398 RepID=UPI0033E8C550